jgi:hypothetical protein
VKSRRKLRCVSSVVLSESFRLLVMRVGEGLVRVYLGDVWERGVITPSKTTLGEFVVVRLRRHVVCLQDFPRWGCGGKDVRNRGLAEGRRKLFRLSVLGWCYVLQNSAVDGREGKTENSRYLAEKGMRLSRQKLRSSFGCCPGVRLFFRGENRG